MYSIKSTGLPDAVIAMVLARYQEPPRYYHGVDHIQSMFFNASERGLELSQAQTLAILFHDVIYVPGAPRGMNEELSAQMLRVMAFDYVAPGIIAQADHIILDTINHKARSEAAKVVLDLDLAGLALPYNLFLRHGDLIYLENRPLLANRKAFDQARADFMRALAERTTIFSSDSFSDLESLARANIKRLLQTHQEALDAESD